MGNSTTLVDGRTRNHGVVQEGDTKCGLTGSVLVDGRTRSQGVVQEGNTKCGMTGSMWGGSVVTVLGESEAPSVG